jgi:osmoprotectant transport system substrate-binding protein
MRIFVRATAVFATAVLSLSLAACGGDSKKDNPLGGSDSGGGAPKSGTIVVGSANFPENVLLGEIYAQALQAKGIKVEKKLNIGAREIIYKSIQNGELSVLPEYNGALLAFVNKDTKAVTTDDVNAELKQKLPASLGILDSSKAEDKDSVTVTKATADKYKLKAIGDLKPVAGQLVIGGPPEYKTRTQGLIGLEKVYGLKFKSFKSLDVAGPLSVSALKKGDVQAADLFTTDPAIAANNFVSLEDTQNLFSAQNVTPLINKAAVNADAQAVLNSISTKLTTTDLLNSVKQIAVDKADPATVAKDWLKTAGLG